MLSQEKIKKQKKQVGVLKVCINFKEAYDNEDTKKMFKRFLREAGYNWRSVDFYYDGDVKLMGGNQEARIVGFTLLNKRSFKKKHKTVKRKKKEKQVKEKVKTKKSLLNKFNNGKRKTKLKWS
ncbi:MAG: hypothetical protein GF317_04620 [Candidatus Lokiarchaeota archaeon]|nr:hypothetical protein [Candidatus Lokiarchaeota archaeon]